MRKVLIADRSEEFCDALHKALSGEFSLSFCHEGNETVRMIAAMKPDVLVLDMMMCGLDGISILQHPDVQAQAPATLVTLFNTSGYILDSLRGLRISYIMVKPCDITAITNRIRDLAYGTYPDYYPEPNYYHTVTEHLLGLGICPNINGYSFLREAILFRIHNPDLAITKHLYPAVAAASGTGATAVQVERCMRTAIRSAWERRDNRAWKQYFGSDKNGIVTRPNNSRFISQLAEIIAHRSAGVSLSSIIIE